MYQFNAIGSPIAKYSNFTTNLPFFSDLGKLGDFQRGSGGHGY